MKTEKIILTASALITFTPLELRILKECSHAHYDHECRGASRVGGAIFAARNLKGRVRVTTEDVDLLCKVLEMPNPLQYLRGELSALLTGLNGRYQEIQI